MKLEEEISQKEFTNNYVKAAVNLIFTNSWLNEFQAKRLKKFELTQQQFNILRILRGQYPKGATVKLLKERMLDKMSDASRLVEKLRMKGFVDRCTGSTDRRTVDVRISDKGLDVLKQIDEREYELINFMANLNSEEIDKLNCMLDKLRG